MDAAAGVGARGYLVYKRLAAGEMEAWLESKRLPLVGGTVPTLSMEEMREAYPYLGEGEGAGGNGFAGIKAAVVVEDAAASGRQAPHCRPCVQGRATCIHVMHMLHAHDMNMHSCAQVPYLIPYLIRYHPRYHPVPALPLPYLTLNSLPTCACVHVCARG